MNGAILCSYTTFSSNLKECINMKCDRSWPFQWGLPARCVWYTVSMDPASKDSLLKWYCDKELAAIQVISTSYYLHYTTLSNSRTRILCSWHCTLRSVVSCDYYYNRQKDRQAGRFIWSTNCQLTKIQLFISEILRCTVWQSRCCAI